MYVIKSTNNLIITATNNNMIKRYYIFILINEFIKKKKLVSATKHRCFQFNFYNIIKILNNYFIR